MTALADLFEHWDARDQLYRRRRGGLTEDEINSIHAYRALETKDLPPDDERLAKMALSRWEPPVGTL